MSAKPNKMAKLRGRLCINAEFSDVVGILCGPFKSREMQWQLLITKAIPAIPSMFGAYVLVYKQFQPNTSQTRRHGPCNLPYVRTTPSVVAGSRAFQSQDLS
eukprot:scaffold15714_cov29-Prasinocladus_malaysianus.AAC.1